MLANQKPGKKVIPTSQGKISSFTATGVSKNLHPGSFQKSLVSVTGYCIFHVDERPNHIEKAAVLKIPMFV